MSIEVFKIVHMRFLKLNKDILMQILSESWNGLEITCRKFDYALTLEEKCSFSF